MLGRPVITGNPGEVDRMHSKPPVVRGIPRIFVSSTLIPGEEKKGILT